MERILLGELPKPNPWALEYVEKANKIRGFPWIDNKPIRWRWTKDPLNAFLVGRLLGNKYGSPPKFVITIDNNTYRLTQPEDKEGIIIYGVSDVPKGTTDPSMISYKVGKFLGKMHYPKKMIFDREGLLEGIIFLMHDIREVFVVTSKGDLMLREPHVFYAYKTDLPYRKVRPILEENAARVMYTLGLDEREFLRGYIRGLESIKRIIQQKF